MGAVWNMLCNVPSHSVKSIRLYGHFNSKRRIFELKVGVVDYYASCKLKRGYFVR